MCAWHDGEQISNPSLREEPVDGSIHVQDISTTHNCYDDAGGSPTKHTGVFKDSPRLGFTYCSPYKQTHFQAA